MKILSISNLYKFQNVNKTSSAQERRQSSLLSQPICDVVSFSAKKYDMEDIVNPTNHCAYCGCKVYNERQIESIAKEMLSSKYEKLNGKVKSVLEKLEEAKNSPELAIAKELENEEEIKFFKNLLDVSSKKAYLKCEDVFKQVYNIDSDAALSMLIKNLHPLQKTIDHVSPQNLEQENNCDDANLVEACYCCNHDLKQGVSFSEFYAMFPSIKNNMPAEKLKFALSLIPENSVPKISANGILRLLKTLYVQKEQVNTQLKDVDYRINSCQDSLTTAISDTEEQIREKEAEIESYQETLDSMADDDEFNFMLRRIGLKSELDDTEANLSGMHDRRSRLSRAMNEIKNFGKKKKDKSKETMTPEERDAKIADYKAKILDLNESIVQQQSKKETLTADIAKIDEKYPPYEVIQHNKLRADAVINAYKKQEENDSLISQKEAKLAELRETADKLRAQYDANPEKELEITSYPEEIQQGYADYIDVVEAINYISEHPNGGKMDKLIKSSALDPLISQRDALEDNPLVIQHKSNKEQRRVKNELNKTEKSIADYENQLLELYKTRETLSYQCAEMSREDAEMISEKSAIDLRRLQDKINNLKIPQYIDSLNSEITLLQATIQNLQKELSRINTSNT